ncbi:hypothetical protein ACH4CE_33685 [Streptomyces gelaticus]|uniref:hypothetical protein n=1 Tax=Streptomyces gelaticus TaxID=285446 RepID=UPI0037BAADDE
MLGADDLLGHAPVVRPWTLALQADRQRRGDDDRDGRHAVPLTRRATELEQQILDVRAELAERDEDLAAARAANRELMAQLNR